ncbi:unnamed protein product [Rotaria sordida]|uniref:Cleavage stimulation factor 50 kDa subunit n=1 Tax=Rotaria sordida TaxID=392033 RepID=A0A818P691_9BILA|nr:unnamed protein product [Rotaria sordida]CAF3550714.1 unnamed protein product [Rotaria sordida]CAF3618189.1 unnamed protein product [Rotaria sordida]
MDSVTTPGTLNIPQIIRSETRLRETTYRLIISQLFYDGHQQLAVSLSNLLQTSPPCPPSDRLTHIVRLGLKAEEELEQTRKASIVVSDNVQDIGLDFDYQSDSPITSPDAGSYETFYVTAHKAPCRAAAFDATGSIIATGSADASIKILDVDRMLIKNNFGLDYAPSSIESSLDNHPVMRTLYDHADEVTCLDFHPYDPILASGSRDYTIKFFEYSKPTTKKSFRSISEVDQIRCLNFHPSGDWLVVGTQHPVTRLYDVETGRCFVSTQPQDQHTKAITCVKWASNGRQYATSSKDGSFKIWDGVTNRCINTFDGAHGGEEVCSVMFTKNSKYLLTSGKDSQVRLWELSTARCLIHYTGAGTLAKQEHRATCVFNHTEDYILYPDEKATSLCCWNSRNAERQRLLGLGHNAPVKCIVHSPTAAAFVTCSDDHRARFWCKRTLFTD